MLIAVTPVIVTFWLARITNLPASPRTGAVGFAVVGVDVGVGVCVAVDVGVCVAVDVGVCVAVDVGVCVTVDVGVCVAVDVGVCVAVDVGVCVDVGVGVGVESLPPQADTSVMDSIMTIDTTNPSMFLFLI